MIVLCSLLYILLVLRFYQKLTMQSPKFFIGYTHLVSFPFSKVRYKIIVLANFYASHILS